MHPEQGPSTARQAARVTLWYLIAALGWIYISDRLTETLPISADVHGWFQTVKGFIFVAVTAAILFLLLRRMFTSIEKSQTDLFLTQFVIDHAADPIYWLTPDAGFAYVNQAACESLEYARDELLTKSLSDVDPGFSRERWRQAWNSLQHFGVLRVETTHLTKTGRLVPVELTANLVNYQGRMLNIAFVRNIAERKTAETRVRETQSRLATVIDVLPGYVFMKDAESRYVLVNRRFTEDFGVAEGEIIGRRHEELFGADSAQRFTAEDRLVLQRGESVYIREEVLHIGDAARTLTTRKVPLRDDRGAVIGLVGLAMDISDRKEMEETLRTTNAALRRANADLEQFAWAAAHDLREPLRTIALYTQLLERSNARELSETAARAMRYIVQSAHRMETLVNDLLAFTQVVNPSADANADANEVARETVEALGAAIRNTAAAVEVADLPPVAVERVHLRQVLQNLIANAIQYRDADRPARVFVSAERSGDDAVFRIRDNGIGIKPEYHEHIFGLFKRLHGLDIPGNGIGLALCRKIVEHYGGRIWVESAPGQGATFAFTVPAVRGSAVPA